MRKSWERRHTIYEAEDGGERTYTLLEGSQASPTRPSDRNNTQIKM